ncbi:hypothetical protein V6N11_021551 [Hibiscus sabdariffa]|uniref:Uncharacterized protein n=2 Tax=Hibiscus sabdariffa TaxID=183260 RepID=A0ABR2NHR5_9ROSI
MKFVQIPNTGLLLYVLENQENDETNQVLVHCGVGVEAEKEQALVVKLKSLGSHVWLEIWWYPRALDVVVLSPLSPQPLFSGHNPPNPLWKPMVRKVRE